MSHHSHSPRDDTGGPFQHQVEKLESCLLHLAKSHFVICYQTCSFDFCCFFFQNGVYRKLNYFYAHSSIKIWGNEKWKGSIVWRERKKSHMFQMKIKWTIFRPRPQDSFMLPGWLFGEFQFVPPALKDALTSISTESKQSSPQNAPHVTPGSPPPLLPVLWPRAA